MTKRNFFGWMSLVLAFILMGIGDSAPWWLVGAVFGVVGMWVIADEYEVRK